MLAQLSAASAERYPPPQYRTIHIGVGWGWRWRRGGGIRRGGGRIFQGRDAVLPALQHWTLIVARTRRARRLRGFIFAAENFPYGVNRVIARALISGCPLAAVAPGHPEICHLAAALISEIVQVPVREHCDRGEQPLCCFEVMSG